MSANGLFFTEQSLRDQVAIMSIALCEIIRMVDLGKQDRREVETCFDRISAAVQILDGVEGNLDSLHTYLAELVEKIKGGVA